jgi:hypothetical protein
MAMNQWNAENGRTRLLELCIAAAKIESKHFTNEPNDTPLLMSLFHAGWYLAANR